MYCTVCGKPFNVRDLEQVVYHETKCEPFSTELPEDAGYARLEDELPSITPMQLMNIKHSCTIEEILSLIRKVTSSLQVKKNN